MVIERFVVKAPHDGQPSVFGGTVLETLSNGQVVESPLTVIPVNELADWIPELNANLLVENQSLQTEVSALQTEKASLEKLLADVEHSRDTLLLVRDQLNAQIEELQLRPTQSQLDEANSRILELEAQLNPPNPFPDTDWQGFRSAALASPTILKMAMANTGNFVMLLIYMTEMQKDQTAMEKMATVWNEMENKTPLSPEEITGINTLAEHFKVPLVLNSDGQIQL